MIYYNGIYYW